MILLKKFLKKFQTVFMNLFPRRTPVSAGLPFVSRFPSQFYHSLVVAWSAEILAAHFYGVVRAKRQIANGALTDAGLTRFSRAVVRNDLARENLVCFGTTPAGHSITIGSSGSPFILTIPAEY